jgi:hypothetical protein
MNPKLRVRFDALSPEVSAHTATILLKKYKDLDVASPLFDACVKAKIDSADVIMSLASDPDPMSVTAMEILSGKSIQKAGTSDPDLPPAPSAQGRKASGSSPRAPRAPAGPRAPRVGKSDPRIITFVMPNPKKTGSKSAARYEFYEVGKRLDEVVAKDKLRWDDISWDLARGHIMLGTLADLAKPGEPNEPEAITEPVAPEVVAAE